MNLIKLLWVIAVHSVIHGVIGAFFVSSSEYVNRRPELIYSFLVVNIIIVFLGAGVLCIVLWRRPFCARFFGSLLIVMSLVYFFLGLSYFIKYMPFFANSLLDIIMFRRGTYCWVGPESPLTIWHVVSVLLISCILVLLVYGFLLFKYAYLACCIPCPPPPCKPKEPKPKKCLPVCPRPEPAPCPPPPKPSCCAPPPPPPPPPCPPPCPPPSPPPCPPPCPPPSPPTCGVKKPPKFVVAVNKII